MQYYKEVLLEINLLLIWLSILSLHGATNKESQVAQTKISWKIIFSCENGGGTIQILRDD